MLYELLQMVKAGMKGDGGNLQVINFFDNRLKNSLHIFHKERQ